MKRKIRLVCGILSMILLLPLITGCGGNAEQGGAKKFSIVTTIFPEYEWVKNVVGDDEHFEVTFLLDNGVDLHSFQPTTDDIIKISSCDLFIYVGGESDSWVKDALKQAVNKDMVVLNLMEKLGSRVVLEEVKEGMEAHEHDEDHEHDGDPEHDEDHDEDHDEEDHDEEDHDEDHEGEEPEYDEHIWLSLKNASYLIEVIRDALCEMDPADKARFHENAASYKAKIDALDLEYAEAVSAGSVKTLLFGDRFPFLYLVRDYGLDYYAAFSGCSAECEASFETVTFLANKIDELKLSHVLKLKDASHRIAETLILTCKSEGVDILILDSMQGTGKAESEDGVTYLGIMEENLQVLKQALN